MQRLDPKQKDGREVREMFAGIAPRYDFLNHLLSVGLDRRWRRVAVRESLAGSGRESSLEVLDVCCGTGDLAADFAREDRVGRVVGVDFVEPMVRIASSKWGERSGRARTADGSWLVGDAMRIPLESGRFDVVSVAFGLRNLVDPRQGLREFARMLRPGGRVAVLEFFPPPRGVSQRLFRAYFHHVLPRVGRLLCPQGRFDAYRYLPDSVEAFAEPGVVEGWMSDAGLRPLQRRRMCFGTVALLVAERTSERSLDVDDRAARDLEPAVC